MALVVVLAAVLVLAAGRLGGVLVDRAQARSAADAAALAAAVGGDEQARSVAAGSGGEVVTIEWHGAEVEVTVEVGDARATSRARAAP